MKRKIFILLTVLMLAALAACGGGDSEPDDRADERVEQDERADDRRDEPPAENVQGDDGSSAPDAPDARPEEAAAPDLDLPGGADDLGRGVWDGNVYLNEQLGLYFNMPYGWVSAADGAMGELLDDMLGMPMIVHDLMATDINTGAVVQIIYERLFFAWMDEEAYIEAGADAARMMGWEIETGFPPVRFGNYEWQPFEQIMDMMGMEIRTRNFVNIQDGYARMLSMTPSLMGWQGGPGDSVEGLMALFGDIRNAPAPTWTPADLPFLPDFPDLTGELPAPVAPDANHPLIGVWAWDDNDGYIYNFNPDGTGTRGFAIMEEEFTWTAEGDHLIVNTPTLAESWTFTIDGGVLTIDSRQLPGMSFNYIRQ